MPINVENGVNAAALGNGKHTENVSAIVGIYFPRSFESGCWRRHYGNMHRSVTSYAGEANLLPIGIDWMTINYDDPKEVGVAFLH
ncbi:hypothetical protein BK127_38480 [Paenibacillus sp. FSL H7-0331]|nr:hypothetical protein BK127_38480 [Paenibacillus sp. FSL H7-0331]